jgi:hypothetical protein
MGKFYNNVRDNMLNAIPSDKWQIDVDDIKMEWKDITDENGTSLHEIFAAVTRDEDYERCMMKALLQFNMALPQTGFGPGNHPDPYLWIKQSFLEVLDEMIMYHSANYFSGSSGGVSTPVHERVQILQGERSTRKQVSDQRQRELKTHLNMEMAYGNIIPPGGYGNIYG